jgi:hypothetical protein
MLDHLLLEHKARILTERPCVQCTVSQYLADSIFSLGPRFSPCRHEGFLSIINSRIVRSMIVLQTNRDMIQWFTYIVTRIIVIHSYESKEPSVIRRITTLRGCVHCGGYHISGFQFIKLSYSSNSAVSGKTR